VKKDPKVHITFILECIELIQKYIKSITYKKFLSSSQMQDAVIRRIELIGEAVRNIPNEVKEKHPEIQWNRISGMRNLLIHDYLGIDLKITWRVAIKEIPDLKKKILEIRKELK
jgi:uncharacterized protein with HEPN domain